MNRIYLFFVFVLLFFSFVFAKTDKSKIPDIDYKFISIDMENVSVNTMLNFLAKKMNYNIVIDNSIDKKITLHLKHVPIFKAFDIILKLANLRAVLVTKNTFYVTTKDNISKVGKTITKVFKLKYINSDIAKKYLSSIDNLKVFSESSYNLLIVQGLKEDIKKAKDILNQIDIKDAQELTKIYKLKNADVVDVYNLIVSLYSNETQQNNENENTQEQTNQEQTNQEQTTTSGSISGLSSSNYLTSQDVNTDQQTTTNEQSVNSNSSNLPFYLSIDRRTNTLVVRGSKFYINKIDKIISSIIDKRVKQVLISVKVLEVAKSKTKELGLEWNSPVATVFTEKPTDYVPLGQDSGGGGGEGEENNVVMVKDGLRVSYRTPLQIQLAIHAILDKGWGKVLANTRITAWDRYPANILIGDRVPIVTQTVTQQLQNGGTATSININYIQVGTSLKITPYLNDKDYITLDILPEVSSIVKYVSAFGQKVPQIGTRTAHTKLTVKDNHTIVLGGLIKDSERHNVVKVPILGDIPIIGKLFFTKSYKEAKSTEVVFLITPHIIHYKDDIKSNKNKENNNSK